MTGMYRSSEVMHGIRVNRVTIDDVTVTVFDMGHDPDMRDCPRYMGWYSLDCCEYDETSKSVRGDDVRAVCDMLAGMSLWHGSYAHTRVVLALNSMANYIDDPLYQMMARM